MATPHQLYEEILAEKLVEVGKLPLTHDDSAKALSNLEKFTKCEPTTPEPTPMQYVPETKLQKLRHGMWRVYTDPNFGKVVGAFAGIATTVTVVYATIKRDHVVEKTALQQANQRY